MSISITSWYLKVERATKIENISHWGTTNGSMRIEKSLRLSRVSYRLWWWGRSWISVYICSFCIGIRHTHTCWQMTVFEGGIYDSANYWQAIWSSVGEMVNRSDIITVQCPYDFNGSDDSWQLQIVANGIQWFRVRIIDFVINCRHVESTFWQISRCFIQQRLE